MEVKRLVRAFVVDDDQNSTALLLKLLKSYSVEIIGTATDATEEVSDEIIDKEPDLLFLDVEMPSMSGIDFCATIRPQVKPDMKVVFYTGYDKYMLEALRQQAFDYMLKPMMRLAGEELPIDPVELFLADFYGHRIKSSNGKFIVTRHQFE
jgi:two-component system LytT family response regulator